MNYFYVCDKKIDSYDNILEEHLLIHEILKKYMQNNQFMIAINQVSAT